MNVKRQSPKGFTLVELLVVIAVIAILLGLAFPNFMGARQRARDTQRKSDVKQIQKALELAKSDINPQAYPTQVSNRVPVACGLTWSAGSNTYMAHVPCDPNGSSANPTPYYYVLNATDSFKYTLGTCLENASDPDRDTSNNSALGCPSGYGTFTLTEP